MGIDEAPSQLSALPLSVVRSTRGSLRSTRSSFAAIFIPSFNDISLESDEISEKSDEAAQQKMGSRDDIATDSGSGLRETPRARTVRFVGVIPISSDDNSSADEEPTVEETEAISRQIDDQVSDEHIVTKSNYAAPQKTEPTEALLPTVVMPQDESPIKNISSVDEDPIVAKPKTNVSM